MQAFAREIGAVLINVRGSTILSKYIGDSERLTAGIFSLAVKFAAHGQTVILFIDEVDALLGQSSTHEHEVMRNVRTEFMQLWDGLLRAARVLVVAATNKPHCLSDAIWRRFSSHFEVPHPPIHSNHRAERACAAPRSGSFRASVADVPSRSCSVRGHRNKRCHGRNWAGLSAVPAHFPTLVCLFLSTFFYLTHCWLQLCMASI